MRALACVFCLFLAGQVVLGQEFMVRVEPVRPAYYEPSLEKAKAIEPILSFWREFKDSCYADSSEVECYPDPAGRPYKVWMHKDPNDLPAFMEFLDRRRLW